MIGYYVHHRGAGHLQRAIVVSAALHEPVTILTSLDQPRSWMGGWVHLPMDTDVDAVDPTVGGDFHWAPLGSMGLTERMAILSAWIRRARPGVIVVDVSVEIAVFSRLHGVRVVTFAQPGQRTDAAHTLGYHVASAIIAPWPRTVNPIVVHPSVQARFHCIGAISRLPVAAGIARNNNRVAILNGTGGRGASSLDTFVAQCMSAQPNSEWIQLKDASIATVDHTLRTSGLALAHCGQNAVAEIAACRTPAIFVPEDRPHGEQHALGRALKASSVPALVSSPADARPRASLLAEARDLDGNAWSTWVTGQEASRAASIIETVAAGTAATQHLSAS